MSDWAEQEEEMKIQRIEEQFSICKLKDLSQVDWKDTYCFVGKTEEENSLVCATQKVPGNATECDHGWRGFRVQGSLDFSLVGILSEITSILAEHRIGVFAVSTYNTDYIFTKEENFDRAIEALQGNGYGIAG